MKQQIIESIVQQMLAYLDNVQLKRLQNVLEHELFDCEIKEQEECSEDDSKRLLELFITAKRIEGCSERTLKYYQTTIDMMLDSVGKNVRRIQTEDLRAYLMNYQGKNNPSRVTIDNIRRILSSFFSWLEDEDYILKSPVRRIHKVKTATNVKETYTDEDLDWTDSGSRVVYEHENPEARAVELVESAVEDWQSYETVFIGYPIWWGIAAWPVDEFISANDFTGKTVIPFCTSASSGLGESGELLAEAAGTGNWLEGMRFRSSASQADVEAWVEELGIAD